MNADFNTQSSKRKSVLPTILKAAPAVKNQDDTLQSQQALTDGITLSANATQADASPAQANFINSKIESMLAATTSLKGESTGDLLLGPLVPVKKRRIMNSKVLVKVRSALGGRLGSLSSRKQYDAARDDHLLDNSLNDDDLSQSVTNMDIRLNEGGSPSSITDYFEYLTKMYV